MRERLTVLQVAYPFAPVGPDAVGGAEQVLAQLDRALVSAGHRSIVVACEGSTAAGHLVAAALPPGALTEETQRTARASYAQVVARAVARHTPDIVHMHGIDFGEYLPAPGVPVLATLHLPPGWYPPGVFRPSRPDTWLHAVSETQHRACPPSPLLLSPIPNGVPVHTLPAQITRRGFALCLGRICPEKNQHEALQAGKETGIPVLLGGQIFDYPDHQQYWRERVEPALVSGRHRFLGPVSFARKRRLLSAARCLISASLAPETSSLVAMEAAACGTPVVAFASGALPEIVRNGVTGFLVKDVLEMAEALRMVDRIDRQACREEACRRFNARAMVARYLQRYAALASRVDARDGAA